MRVCTTPGCGTLVKQGAYKGRCPACNRAVSKARGTRAEQGYGAEHRRERRAWQQRIDAGEVVCCWRCGERIVGAFHLGHDDYDRSITHGPECALCNLSAAGKMSGHGPD
jgi:hypothetical protein